MRSPPRSPVHAASAGGPTSEGWELLPAPDASEDESEAAAPAGVSMVGSLARSVRARRRQVAGAGSDLLPRADDDRGDGIADDGTHELGGEAVDEGAPADARHSFSPAGRNARPGVRSGPSRTETPSRRDLRALPGKPRRPVVTSVPGVPPGDQSAPALVLRWLHALDVDVKQPWALRTPRALEFSDGVILCKLVAKLEAAAGRLRGVIAGVHLAPRTAAARLQNIRRALSLLRGVKAMPVEHLWSDTAIRDGMTAVLLPLLLQMRRLYAPQTRSLLAAKRRAAEMHEDSQTGASRHAAVEHGEDSQDGARRRGNVQHGDGFQSGTRSQGPVLSELSTDHED